MLQIPCEHAAFRAYTQICYTEVQEPNARQTQRDWADKARFGKHKWHPRHSESWNNQTAEPVRFSAAWHCIVQNTWRDGKLIIALFFCFVFKAGFCHATLNGLNHCDSHHMPLFLLSSPRCMFSYYCPTHLGVKRKKSSECIRWCTDIQLQKLPWHCHVMAFLEYHVNTMVHLMLVQYT